MEGERPPAPIACAAVDYLGAGAVQDEIEVGSDVHVGRKDHFGAIQGLDQGDGPDLPTAVRSPEEGARSQFREHDLPLAESVLRSRSPGYSIERGRRSNFFFSHPCTRQQGRALAGKSRTHEM
jgi:hypothetical protein